MVWFRLGRWRWQGKKGEDGKRLCPLCGELDGEFHILGECKELEGVREICKMGGKIRSWGWQHWVKTRDQEVVKEMGKYLKMIRRARGKTLKKLFLY